MVLPMRPTYDNSHNRNRVRIDTRNQADPAVQAGMRKIHRGMDGQVIGGVTAEGQGIGTKGGKPAWRSSGASPAASAGAGAAPRAISRPNALGGGLGRWERLNPNAKQAFAAGSPANTKSENRRLARDQALPAVPAAPADTFVKAAMPKPAVPSPVPLRARAGSMAAATPAAARPVANAAATFPPFQPKGQVAPIASPAIPRAAAAPRAAVAPPQPEPNRWADGTPIVPKASAPAAPARPADNRPVMSGWTPKAAPPKPDARHKNRLAARTPKTFLPNHTMTTPEAMQARLKAQGQAKVAADAAQVRAANEARAKRVAADQAAVTVPEWQQGTTIGRLNERWQKYRASVR